MQAVEFMCTLHPGMMKSLSTKKTVPPNATKLMANTQSTQAFELNIFPYGVTAIFFPQRDSHRLELRSINAHGIKNASTKPKIPLNSKIRVTSLSRAAPPIKRRATIHRTARRDAQDGSLSHTVRGTAVLMDSANVTQYRGKAADTMITGKRRTAYDKKRAAPGTFEEL